MIQIGLLFELKQHFCSQDTGFTKLVLSPLKSEGFRETSPPNSYV